MAYFSNYFLIEKPHKKYCLWNLEFFRIVHLGRKSLLGRELFAKPTGHCGIALGNSSSIVGDQTEDDLVIAHVDIWMVSCGLCQVGYSVYKRHGSDKVLESPFPHELSPLQRPFGVVSQYIIDLS
jgi:hypothetical protein